MFFRRIATGLAGRQVSRALGGGTLGTVAAAALPFVAKRGLGPLGAALTAGWAVRKGLEWRRNRRLREQAYPDARVPVTPPPA
ncbi:hypothetical protein [Sphingomicrobium astaxanthinifaciens]|uniref:hypothetical protein n=1 Tax=Sphingomicrobium astaxanthinifaciens TaxID=1227949 RepID=UPI001FCC597B|nr:hypothetical protein [Sphingomicrobium astaxanthinifaciens]MCJ7420758.1 hypothetical protein [Sphingomicrobium astaxanthinifaciens]